MYKLLIVDDEPNAREMLISILMVQQEAFDIVVVDTIDKAVRSIAEKKPDLIFLDIHMPHKNGLELYNEADLSDIKVVFTTAFDNYAIKAIKLSALDYILKPIGPNEVWSIIDKFKAQFQKDKDIRAQHELLNQLLSDRETTTDEPKQLVINLEDTKLVLKFSDIIRLQGDRNYTKIITHDRHYISAKTLKEFEEMICGESFFRIHKSHIVNRSVIQSIRKSSKPYVKLTTGEKLELSRLRKANFFDWLYNNHA